MTLYALSEITFGMGEDGVKEFHPGDKVTGLPEETMKNLVERGNVVKYDPTNPDATSDENEELEQENARLKQELANLKAQLEASQQGGAKPSSGATAPSTTSSTSGSSSTAQSKSK